MKRAGKRIRRALSALLLALVLTVGISAAVCRVSLKTTEYTAAVRGLTVPLRTVVLSDLHSREYGKDNAALLARVAQQQPDAIFCVGDFIDSDAAPAQLQRLYQLLRRLGEIAPVFFSPGNHEIAYMESHGSELLDAVAATGATVLYDRWVQTTLGGAVVRIGGSCGHFRDINRSAKLDYAMEETIGAADVPGIVLLHMPESLSQRPHARRRDPHPADRRSRCADTGTFPEVRSGEVYGRRPHDAHHHVRARGLCVRAARM